MVPQKLSELVSMDANTLSQLIHAREVSCVEVMQPLLEHIARYTRWCGRIEASTMREVIP